jgi:hypothetical protein
MLKTTSSFVKITKETAPNLIERLQKGEGSNVFYGVMKNGKPTLHSGQSITSPKTRQAVIDKIIIKRFCRKFTALCGIIKCGLSLFLRYFTKRQFYSDSSVRVAFLACLLHVLYYRYEVETA